MNNLSLVLEIAISLLTGGLSVAILGGIYKKSKIMCILIGIVLGSLAIFSQINNIRSFLIWIQTLGIRVTEQPNNLTAEKLSKLSPSAVARIKELSKDGFTAGMNAQCDLIRLYGRQVFDILETIDDTSSDYKIADGVYQSLQSRADLCDKIKRKYNN